MEGESIKGNSVAADIPQCKLYSMFVVTLYFKFTHIKISSPVGFLFDQNTVNKSTKPAQKTDSENKNKQVAKPESQEDICDYFNLSDFEPAEDFYEIQPEIYSPTLMGGNESVSFSCLLNSINS
jgi:hypothetical protein